MKVYDAARSEIRGCCKPLLGGARSVVTSGPPRGAAVWLQKYGERVSGVGRENGVAQTGEERIKGRGDNS